MTAVVRLYAEEGQARAAAQKLVDEGLSESTIQILAPPNEEAADVKAVGAQALKAGYTIASSLPADRAAAAADALQAGQTIVICDAPFGYAVGAETILDEFDPVDSEAVSAPKEPRVVWDEGAPLSSALRLKVLIKDKPDLLSDFIGINTLSSGRTWLSRAFGEHAPNFSFSRMLGMKELSSNPTPFSSMTGMKPLSSNPTPFSSMTGMKPLSKPKANWTSSFGMPLLSKKKSGEWTHSFGIPLLKKD